MLEPGKQITNYLRLVRVLGGGGMGRIWVAEHQTLQTEVAVKLLNAELAEDEQWLVRFRREAQAVAKIDSAHVVRVFDHGVTSENIPFIVMELLRGQDLGKRLERAPLLSVEEIALILTQTCKALGRAHELGVVHRDVKPENIFLTSEGNELFVKMLDFGIAKQVTAQDMQLTDSQTSFGTPYYMSPEQVMSTRSVDHRADLWALGVVTYQMVTGLRPFTGATPGAIYVQINSGTYGPPSAIRTDVSPQADAWFKRALSRDVDSRFSSAREMAEAFRQAVGVPTTTASATKVSVANPSREDVQSAGTGSASVQTIRRTKSHPRSLWLGGLGLFVIVVTTLWGRLARHRDVEHSVAPADSPPASLSAEPAKGLSSSAAVPSAAEQAARADVTDAGANISIATSPSAHLPSRKVINKGASKGTPNVPAVPRPANPRPIKDRGF